MRKTLLGGIAAAVILLSTTACELDEAAEPATQKGGEKPVKVEKTKKKGGPIKVGNWQVQGKLIPKAEQFTGDFTATFRVKNISDASDQAWFTLNVLKGNDIFTSMDCIGPEIAAGQVGTIDCTSTDKFRKGWTSVTLENSI